MKLQELKEYSGHASTSENYLEYLKNKGYDIPLLRGNKGFLFKSFEPTSMEKKFKTLSDAKKFAPKKYGKLWVIFNTANGKVVSMPDWWEHDHHTSWVHRKQY